MAEGEAVSSAFFEVRFDDFPENENLTEDEKKEPTGGLSFNVDLDNEMGSHSENEKNLQLAARLHRIKSEMRRSNANNKAEPKTQLLQPQQSQDSLDNGDQMDSSELNVENKSQSSANSAGTYTLRLDSAEIRERKNLINITIDTFQEQSSATESAELPESKPCVVDEFESNQEFEIPVAVSARITEWFTRNEMAESRNSGTSTATDSNLDDIREKAKTRIKERKELTEKTSSDTLDDISGITESASQTKPSNNESKIVLSREERTQAKKTIKQPQIRLTRAMLLRKNKALGIKNEESKTKPAMAVPAPIKKTKSQQSLNNSITSRPVRQVTSRLDNLSKPKRQSEVGLANVARQRSFSHEQSSRGRTSTTKPTISKAEPERKANSRSSSAHKDKNISVAKKTKQDLLSQSVRVEKSTKPTQRPVRSASLTRSTGGSLKIRSLRTVSQKNNSEKLKDTAVVSSSSSSRNGSRPQTATSVRESHENSILYSLNVISNNCLMKTKDILLDIIGDISEVNEELEKLNSIGDTGQDLEGVFGRICALDKCLGKIRTAQISKKNTEVSPDMPKEEISECIEKSDESNNP